MEFSLLTGSTNLLQKALYEKAKQEHLLEGVQRAREAFEKYRLSFQRDDRNGA